MSIILFSCTFAPAAKSYTVHLYIEEQNGVKHKHTKATFYFTQNSLYNYVILKSMQIDENIAK